MTMIAKERHVHRQLATLIFAGAAIVSVSTLTTLAQTPSAIPAPTAAEPSALADFQRAWAKVKSYSATVIVFEREGADVQSSVLDYTFSKPASATVHFTAGANTGVTVVWGGGNTVVAHRGSGLVALFKKSFPLHDPQVTTIRGSSVDELSFAALIAHAQDTPGVISQEAGPSILGIPTEAVTLVPTTSATNGGLTREVVDFSTLTSLPLRVLGYQGDTLMRQIDFSNVKLQP